MKKTKMTTKALSMFLSVIMLFTMISVGIIVPETKIEADAAEVGETHTVTTIAQINDAIAKANTAGVNKITTIKLGGNIQYNGSLASFTTLSTANVVFDFNGYSLLMNYTVSGEYESSQTGVQLPSENAGRYYNGTDMLTKGMFNISAGSTLQIINSKPGNISTMQAYTEFVDSKKNSTIDHQTSSTLIYSEGTLIVGSLNTSYNDFSLYAHSKCAATNGDNPNLYGKKSATANVNTVTINNDNAVFKMYGGKINATGSARSRRGTYSDILCYALNVNACYSAEIYGGEINVPKHPSSEQNNGIFQSTSKACEGGTARITAIRCNTPYLYIFNVTSSVQSKTGTDSSNSNTQYTSNIWTTDAANAPYVYGGKFDYYVEKGDNSSTANNIGYIVRGAYKLASNGALTSSSVSGTNYSEQSADQGGSKTGSVVTYTVFIGDNGVVKDASNNIVKTNMAAENGIDMFSYDTFKQYLAQYSTTLDIYHGNSIMTTNGDETQEVGSNNYLLNGYTHEGWAGKTHPGAAYDLNFVTPEKAAITGGGSLFLVPAWKENVYTITYDWNDGDGASKVSDTSSCPTSYKITSTSTFGTPVRHGYKFKTWAVTEYSYPSTDTKKPWSLAEYPAGFPLNGKNGNITLQAKWELITYDATFDLNGGNIAGDSSDVVREYNVNKVFQFPQGVQKNYYTFDGTFKVYSPGGSWKVDENVSYDAGSTSELGNYGDVTFVAQFTPIQYTVTYNSNGGSSVDDETLKTYNYESTHTLPAVTRTGYKFVGWKPEPSGDSSWSGADVYTPGTSFNKMYGNVTLVAQWESATYPLTLDLDATESIPGGITEYNYAYKDALSVNNPVKIGYVFKGWKVSVAPDAGTTWVIGEEFKEGIADGKVIIPANRIGSVTLEPMWELDTYTLSFNVNGGNGVPSQDYNIEESITLPSTTKKGYTFTGWSVFSNEGNWIKEIYNAGDVLTGMYGDVTLIANWKKTNYVISLDANNGTVSPNVLNYDFEKEVALPVPTRTGYSFNGWRVSKIDEGASWKVDDVYTDSVPAGQYGNMTLEAQWVHTEYSIHFTGHGTLPSDAKYYIDSPAFNLSPATNPGYRFIYWNVTTPVGNWEMNEKIYVDTDISEKYGNVTLNANYEAIDYSITYRDIDGTETVVPYNMTTPVVINEYQRDGYTFSGWNAEYVNSSEGAGWPTVCQPGTYGEGERYGNVVLTPILAPTEHNITFIPDGGTPYADLTYTIEAVDTLPVPAKTGYDFAGWKVTAAGGNWNADEIVDGDVAVTGRFGDVTLTAQWTPKKYTITWVTGNGTHTTQAEYDSMPDYSAIDTSKAPDAQYTYTFTGWSPSVSKVTGEATYTALYSKTVNSYTVTWIYDTDDSGNSMVTENVSYRYGEHPVFNNGINPTKVSTGDKYYRFVGWVDADGNYLTTDTLVSGDITYIAEYKEIQAPRKVTWVINGVSTETVWEVGEIPSYVGTPIKPDADGMKYVFTSWSPEVVAVEANTDYVYTAQFSEVPQSYTAEFDLNGGSYSGNTEVTYNKTAGLNMPQPTKVGYTFTGWRVTSNSGTWTQTDLLVFTTYTGLWGDVSFKAEFAPANYTIKAETEEGIKEYTYTIESTDTLPALTQDGYVLSGWTVVSAEGNWIAGDTVAADKLLTGMYGDVTLHPLWTARLYKINWVSGDITQTVEFKFGDPTVTYPPIAKPGYTAVWDKQVPAIMPAEDLTFTAVYSPIQYYLRFNSAGGSAVENFYYDITSAATLPVPTREGAVFKGWKVSASDGNWVKNKVYEGATALTGQYGNITLTAQWEIELHTVTWIAGDITKVTYWYHGAIPSYDGTPVKSSDEYNSYIFDGWDKEITTVTGDVVYTAQFKATERLYVIKWSIDGFVAEEKLYKFGDTPVYTGSTPTRPSTIEFDFTFAGWSPEIGSVTGDVTYIAMFDVFTKLQGLRVDKASVFLSVGEEAVVSVILSPSTATVKDVEWYSADESVAIVDANGKITAIGSGDVVIRVQSKDGNFKSYCVVSVAPVTTEYIVISAGGVSTTRLPGEAIQLTATVMPNNATNKNITWSSSNTAIAKVDATGLVVYGDVAGTAVITAKSDGFAVGTIEVTTTLNEDNINDTVKTYTVMFAKSTSTYIIAGNTYETINIIYAEGDTVEFLLTEPHFATANGVQLERDVDGMFRIKDISKNYTIVSVERADLGFEEEQPDAPAKKSFFDKLKDFFRSIIEFFRNLFG